MVGIVREEDLTIPKLDEAIDETIVPPCVGMHGLVSPTGELAIQDRALIPVLAEGSDDKLLAVDGIFKFATMHDRVVDSAAIEKLIARFAYRKGRLEPSICADIAKHSGGDPAPCAGRI